MEPVGYLALRVLELALSLPPEGGARRLGATFGRIARLMGLRRAAAEGQIAAAFPHRSRAWVRTVAAACYRHFGEELAATARLGRLTGGALVGRVVNVEEPGRVHRQWAAGSGGSIVVTGHLGNWELAGAFLAATGFPVVAVVRRHGGGADRRLAEARARLGVESVYMDEAPRRIPRALAEGKVVALVADQHAASRGVPVPFFGRPASTFRGPARLSLACGVPLFFGALVREGDGYRALLEPVEVEGEDREEVAEEGPVTLPSGKTAEGSAAREVALTRRWVALLERAIRARPEQYFWFHRRWKPVRTARNEVGPCEVGT